MGVDEAADVRGDRCLSRRGEGHHRHRRGRAGSQDTDAGTRPSPAGPHHSLEEAEGWVDGRQGAEQRAGLADHTKLPPALGTPFEVGAHAGRLARRQLAVDQRAQKIAGVGGTHPTVNASRSRARPRWMRLRTVPTGTPRDSLISW